MMHPRSYIVVSGALMILMVIGPCASFNSDRHIDIGLISSENNTLVPFQLVLPAVELALHHARTHEGFPNNYLFRTSFITQGHDWDGLARRLTTVHEEGNLDVIFGPVDEFTTNVAALGQLWNVPVVSVGTDLVNACVDQFPLLIRAGPLNYISMAKMFEGIMDLYNWKKIKLIYQEAGQDDFVNKYCPDAIRVLSSHLQRHGIDTEVMGTRNETIPLSYIQPQTRRHHSIIALCASPDSVRELMIEVNRLNMNNGDYVFLNIDIFSSNDQPWIKPYDTYERSQQAANGFKAVQIITLEKPRYYQRYKMFSNEVKRRSRASFQNSAVDEGPVSPFASYIYDAVMLYTLALKETLDAHLPFSDGRHIASQMRNRSFDGITGTVSMDENGMRAVDHALLTFDPETNRFREAATFWANRQQLEPVPGIPIRWAGMRSAPPPDEIENPNFSSIASQTGGVLSLLVLIANCVVCLGSILT